ncbi:MAG: hypothetical protein ACJ8MR_20875 [Povalibacter sp.]
MKDGSGLQACIENLALGSLVAFALVPSAVHATTYSLVVSGLGGEPSYEQRFREQAQKIGSAAQRLEGDNSTCVVLSGDRATRESLRRELKSLATKAGADDQVILTLIGHGSFDGTQYRFNLPGPDVTDTDLTSLLDQLKTQQVLIVNATSASGAVLERWQNSKRILVTATKSGGERTATRFGEFWTAAVSGSEADVNKDDVVTVSEAFDYASRKVADSFKADALLATEHARLEGAGPERFQVARLGTAARVSTDPELNKMYAERVRIERELDDVKQRKSSLNVDTYYDELEGVLVRLATLQRDIDARGTEGSP